MLRIVSLFLFTLSFYSFATSTETSLKTPPTSSNIPLTTSSASELYNKLSLKNAGLSEEAFSLALKGVAKANLKKNVLAIVDFSLPSSHKRLFVIDLESNQLLFKTYVAHGRNSGMEYANSFSNQNSSYQSSLGFYRTLETYQGKHGLSLKLQGLESGINDHALERAIVIHGADYVSEDFIHRTGRLGRSQGCPAVSVKEAPAIINALKNGAGLFIYSPDNQYVKQSKFV